jgi:hypothetical protein
MKCGRETPLIQQKPRTDRCGILKAMEREVKRGRNRQKEASHFPVSVFKSVENGDVF